MTASAEDRLKIREALVERPLEAAATVSPGAVELAKTAITDGLGVAVAGTTTATSLIARSVLSPADDGVSCWGVPRRVSAPDAAYANAVSAHSLDWDDYMHPMHGHCTTVLLPTCAAVAELMGSSGHDLVEAYLLGYEVNGRLSTVVGMGHYEKGWHSTSTVGVVGAAAAAARLLGLEAEAVWHAMGVAASSSAGLRANFGTRTKALHAGNAARNAVLAGLLVRAGVTANPDWLLGPGGYLTLFGSREPADAVDSLNQYQRADLVIEGPWGLVLKPYPCCGSSHAAAQAIIELATEHDIEPAGVVRIKAQVDPLLMKLLIYDIPATTFEAQYSLRYTLAAALVARRLGMEEFDTANLHRPAVEETMSKIEITADLENSDADRFRAIVAVETAHATVTREVRFADGHPNVPMSRERRRDKYDLAAEPVLGSTVAGDLYELLESLEALPRWSTAAELLGRPADPAAALVLAGRAG